MKKHARFFAITSALAALATLTFAGCATKPGGGDAAAGDTRQAIYKKALRGVVPGMSRQQLYSLLPPAGTPDSTKPALVARSGGLTAECTETYPLDGEFSVEVKYELANGSRYIMQERMTGEEIVRSQNAMGNDGMESQQNMDDKIVSRPKLRRGAQ